MLRIVSRTIVCFVCAVFLLLAGSSAPASIIGISGTMSNFDVFNETGVPVYGAELELEDCHSTDVSKTYPSHFNNMVQNEYSNGAVFGTRITFTGYNFDPSGFIIPTVGQNTNGHYAVNIPGAEHFGFSVFKQPTATRFFWLDQSGQRISNTPLSIPMPSWNLAPPPQPNAPPVIQAVVKVPEPEQPEPQQPDSIWMKVYVTEIEREVDLEELISGPDSIAPHHETEIETEWELLEGGVMSQADQDVGENAKAIIRRYEFFKYTGPYSGEHEPLSTWNGVGEPPAEEMGPFIAANMVAVNFEVPEPSSAMLVLLGAALAGSRRRR